MRARMICSWVSMWAAVDVVRNMDARAKRTVRLVLLFSTRMVARTKRRHTPAAGVVMVGPLPLQLPTVMVEPASGMAVASVDVTRTGVGQVGTALTATHEAEALR